MTNEEQKELEQAQQFSVGLRGQYIMAQALYHAINLMEHVPSPHTEKSDISDMKYLRDMLFNIFPQTIFSDTSTSNHWQFITDVASNGTCTHVVADCEIDLTCECGRVGVQ